MEGIFLGWNNEKPCGIIRPTDGSDAVLVFKKNDVSDQQLIIGTNVSFTLEVTARGRKATNIIVAPPKIVGKMRIGRVKYWDDRGFGFIVPDDGVQDVYFKVDDLPATENECLSAGLEVEFKTAEYFLSDGSKKTQAANVKVIGWRGCEDRLSNFAELGKWYSNSIEILAELSEDGKDAWNYKHNSEEKETLPILRSYIRQTFHRLEEMGEGIIYSGKDQDVAAAFNTGLVTSHREEIFGLFTPNDVSGRQLWKFSKFCLQSDRVFLSKFGSKQIPLANYFDDPSILIFDRRCKLHIYWEHIFDDEHLTRFPENLRGDLTRLRRLLDSAKKDVEWRLARNYRLAIPQYFRDRGREGSIQLLLPICLDHDDYSKVDIALVAEKIISEDGEPVYRCSTVLPLDWAYNNARLLVRPDTGWLQP